ncbi:MAG: phosphate ABC transporter permease subunit PstC [Elusimicrobia bacterium]|nr:phosphate ABC transporter permease subunit PstC [Elusimicrobiota bacterium]
MTPRSPRPNQERRGDRVFRRTLGLLAFSVVLLAIVFAWQLSAHSTLAWKKFGLGFLTSDAWNPVEGDFGALPFIYGTAVSSVLALLIALPLGLGAAIFMAELAPRKLSAALSFLVELLAAVPSVILGLMGIFAVIPAVRWAEPWLERGLGWLPFFRGTPYGVGMLTAGLILSVMVLPYITAIAREVLLAVPRPLKEGMLALGATPAEVVWKVSLPYSRSAVIGATFLALGRALGETMAVTMVIGNTPQISKSLFEPAYTMAAVIANELAEATEDIHLHALIAVGLALFAITLAVNAGARLLVYRLERE